VPNSGPLMGGPLPSGSEPLFSGFWHIADYFSRLGECLPFGGKADSFSHTLTCLLMTQSGLKVVAAAQLPLKDALPCSCK
jgi:hypothetical protein